MSDRLFGRDYPGRRRRAANPFSHPGLPDCLIVRNDLTLRLAGMSLLPLFDLSLIGRAAARGLEFLQPEGSLVTCTFCDLESRSNRLANLLRGRGLNAGDRLAFFLQNRVEVIDLWLAGVKLGLVLVPINVLYRERELKHILADSAPTAVVTSRELAGFISSGAAAWDVDALTAEAAGQPDVRHAVPANADTPMALIYTSGTTGASKGAVLTQGNFAANGTLAAEPSPRPLPTSPRCRFSTCTFANGVHCWLFSGCLMRLTERFEHAKAAAWFGISTDGVLWGAGINTPGCRPIRRGRSAPPPGGPVRRRSPRRCTRSSADSTGR